MAESTNVSSDLIWEICRLNNAYLVKRKSAGGSQFSKDPLNLTNKHSRKAVGVHPAEKGGITLTTKRTKHQYRPTANKHEVTWAGNKSGPKIYRGIVNYTAKQNYRADLRREAVARASAIRQSRQEKKEKPEKKPRGTKAKATAHKV
ncbi:MAG: hypothetical protein Q9211_001719 [Gyalolechia sp. 1 TL-2023]